MRKRAYLREKKSLKRSIKVFKRHIGYNSYILTPIATTFLESTKISLKELNFKYKLFERRNRDGFK